MAAVLVSFLASGVPWTGATGMAELGNNGKVCDKGQLMLEGSFFGPDISQCSLHCKC